MQSPRKSCSLQEHSRVSISLVGKWIFYRYARLYATDNKNLLFLSPLTFPRVAKVTPAATETNMWSWVTSSLTSFKTLATTWGLTATQTTRLFRTVSLLSQVVATPHLCYTVGTSKTAECITTIVAHQSLVLATHIVEILHTRLLTNPDVGQAL